MGSTKKVLVVGSGGREHALALALLKSPSVLEVVVAPGNAGTAQAPRNIEGKRLRNATGDAFEIARLEAPDLVVIGPEAPLCDGIVDELGKAGLPAVFGPSRAAARLEGSKAFMKEFATRCGIRTARHETVRDLDEAARAIRTFERAPVVKADGLCAGKGVVVASTHDEALEACRDMLSGDRFGDAGRTVVIEERIDGAEASVHGICDGERVLLLPCAQDHKRIGDGDTGPNTGGMGAYAPAPIVTAAMMEQIRVSIFEQALRGMTEAGSPYRGALFAGLMITDRGEPYLLEFNVRFGDPETQALTTLVEGDFAALLDGASRGELDPSSIRIAPEHALCIVLAASGYPGAPRIGDEIVGLEAASAVDGVTVYHAGTRREGERVVTSGGRVLGVTGRGATLAEAHERAYRAQSLIEFAGKQVRRDIGKRALGHAP